MGSTISEVYAGNQTSGLHSEFIFLENMANDFFYY
jgi:hypothetical protein